MRLSCSAALAALATALVACSPATTDGGSLPPFPIVEPPTPTGTPPAPTVPTSPAPTTDASTTPPIACAPTTPATTAAPIWRAPAAQQHVCFQQEAQALTDCAFDNTNCNIPSAACKTCAVTTKLVSPAYGPLVIDPQTNTFDLNVGGCVALVSHDSSATGCGPRLQAKLVCEDQACGQCTKPEDAKACGQAADTGVCATAATGAQGCQQYESQCFVGSAKRDAAVGLIMLFCG